MSFLLFRQVKWTNGSPFELMSLRPLNRVLANRYIDADKWRGTQLVSRSRRHQV